MIALIGDVHGEFGVLQQLVARLPVGCHVIQVGDFGYWPRSRKYYEGMLPDRDVLFIDGNHDHVPGLIADKCDWPNAVYVQRGDVWEIDGRRILFFGGATSVDRKWRVRGSGEYGEPNAFHAWFDEEVPSEADVFRAMANGKNIDLMVTHSPPDWMIRANFSPYGLVSFGIDPQSWRDTAAERVEQVWREIGEPPLVCGHMHRSVKDGKCRILDINEVMVI